MTEQDRQTLADRFPIIPHEHSGDCCGCVIPVELDQRTFELRCNECGHVVGVIDSGVLEDLVYLVNRR
jgi:hypothetical protein